MNDPNLVTTITFHGQEYLFKMNIVCGNLEILITDKSSGEEWQCSYDATYIENLTQKTGNFKQFEVFIAMIKSGLLRTSESVTLDLLTFDDLELLRTRKLTKTLRGNCSNNRRYLIVTYAVEFDKIRYPLPLEYCGPPDPVVLQTTIRRLEAELAKAREELAVKRNNSEAKKVFYLQKRVDELTEENLRLQEEVRQLTKLVERKPRNQVLSLQKAVNHLEKCVVNERNSHHELVEKLRSDKEFLVKELEKVKCSERCLKQKLNQSCRSGLGLGDHSILTAKPSSTKTIKMMYKRYDALSDNDDPAMVRKGRGSSRLINISRDSSTSSNKYADAMRLSSVGSDNTPHVSPARARKPRSKSRCSSNASHSSDGSTLSKSSRRRRSKKRSEELDYKKLEEKIEHLQKLLKNNLIRDR